MNRCRFKLERNCNLILHIICLDPPCPKLSYGKEWDIREGLLGIRFFVISSLAASLLLKDIMANPFASGKDKINFFNNTSATSLSSAYKGPTRRMSWQLILITPKPTHSPFFTARYVLLSCSLQISLIARCQS